MMSDSNENGYEKVSDSTGKENTNSYQNSDSSENPINFTGTSSTPFSSTVEDNLDEDVNMTSSLENIIPVQKLRNGWFAISSFVVTKTIAAAEVVKEKSVEAYNSDTVKNIRQSASENWEKTTIAAAPYWEKTKNTVVTAAEVTKEKTINAVEAAKPVLDTVAAQAVAAGTYSWEKVVKAAEMAQEEILKLSNSGSSESTPEHAPSALDDAVKGGGSMTV